MVKLYTRQSLHTTTQLLQGSIGTRAKIWSNYTQDKVYTLQHSYSKDPLELEPKFGQIIHKTKSTHYNTATPRPKSKLYTRLEPKFGQIILVYTLQHSYSKDPVELEPKFGQIIHKDTTTQLLQGSSWN